MPVDIAITPDSLGTFDISIADGDIVGVDGFDSAIYVSLFTDARATDEQVRRPEDRRGWLGNLAPIVDNRQLGGLVWLVEQRRLTQSTLNEIVDFARKSLQWMAEDGICQKVEVSGEIVPTQGIALSITITVKDGITETRYLKLWELTG